MLAERRKQEVPAKDNNLSKLREKVKEHFEGVNTDQPLFIALDDFIKETELEALKKELKEDPQKFINEKGKEGYHEQVEKVDRTLEKLKEEINEKEDDIGGYKSSRMELGSIFSNLSQLTASMIAEENGGDNKDVEKAAFNSTLSFYKGIRAEIRGDE